jgi:peptidoglycan/LPS O-acetylase OafA/YrhL
MLFRMVMARSLSLYLDLLRFLAALAVYLFHAGHFAKERIPFAGNFGGEAVIVFFVLSGMLITMAGVRQPDAGYFIQARLSRLWSVCLPALALTLVADIAGQYLSLPSYHPMQPYSAFKWAASVGINMLFLNQIWGFNIFPGTNGPFWSLSYEFWYYMMFAAFFYVKGTMRIVALACAMLVAGPSIIIAFPIWLMGTAVYFAVSRNSAAQSALGWAIWLGSFAAAIIFSHFELHNILKSIFPEAAANPKWDVNFWPASYLIGAIVAANIYGFSLAGRNLSAPLEKASDLIRFGANISFGLYLFHYPLMYLSVAILNRVGITSGTFFVNVVYVAPFVVSALLALQCEKHKAIFFRLSRGVKFPIAKRRRLAPSEGKTAAIDPLIHRAPSLESTLETKK